MGNLGFQELILILFVLGFFVAIPFIAYRMGKKAGYREGQLDMYRRQDEQK